MKIAIVAPSPVPFVIGGVEALVWKLAETINKKTPHRAELLKLVSREFNFWDLIDNYYQFYNLNLDHFDTVIVTKYPAWMIRHKNVIYYVQHRLRGLYDTYHMLNLPYTVQRGNKYVDEILDYMENNPLPQSLDFYFESLYRLKEKHLSKEVDDNFFSFPAPFIRKILMYMDNWGMSQNVDAKFYSISETVKKRTEYFPVGTEVEVAYHPSALTKPSSGEYNYVFMVSRLDDPKRIDLLINAMQYVKSDVKLYIAGTGPAEAKLKTLARGDKRIEFLGFVNDDVVEEYYSNSLVVPYFPFDEDFGLITIEAMMRKKPVITTIDAGGPTEFVKNDETGFVVSVNPKEIAKKIDYFARNKDEAKRMGENAYKIVNEITWEKTIEKLLSNQENKVVTKRKKITVTSTFPIYPPLGGGQARIFNLYGYIAKKYDVEVVSATTNDKPEFIGAISVGLEERRVPRSQIHEQEQHEKYTKKVGQPVEDIAMLDLAERTPQYGQTLKESIQTSDFVIISHPYTYNETLKYLGATKFAYEAHNVEYNMKKEMLPGCDTSEKLLKMVFEAEKACCENSEFIITCSEEDKKTLSELYGVGAEKMIVVPNGVDCSSTKFTDIKNRRQNKSKLNLEAQTLVLFMGSWHGPNLEASKHVLQIAQVSPDIKFLLMGSQCRYIEQNCQNIPSNVGLLGITSEEEKNRIFSTVDFALNPMTGGSGTNLKMFDYMSAGIPVITTSFGTRGISRKDVFITAQVNEMAETLEKVRYSDFTEMVLEARKFAENTFDWKIISEKLSEKIQESIG